MAQMVDAELQFESILCLKAVNGRHDTSIIDQEIQRVGLFRHRLSAGADGVQRGQIKRKQADPGLRAGGGQIRHGLLAPRGIPDWQQQARTPAGKTARHFKA
jgi:hypothetical protein